VAMRSIFAVSFFYCLSHSEGFWVLAPFEVPSIVMTRMSDRRTNMSSSNLAILAAPRSDFFTRSRASRSASSLGLASKANERRRSLCSKLEGADRMTLCWTGSGTVAPAINRSQKFDCEGIPGFRLRRLRHQRQVRSAPNLPLASSHTSETSNSNFGFFCARSLSSTPHASAIFSSILREWPV